MPVLMATACKSCGNEIIWRYNETSGRRMPIDAVPTAKGNIMLHDDGQAAHVVPRGSLAEIRSLGIDLYISHFATCPQASAHRRGRRDDKQADNDNERTS